MFTTTLNLMPEIIEYSSTVQYHLPIPEFTHSKRTNQYPNQSKFLLKEYFIDSSMIFKGGGSLPCPPAWRWQRQISVG